MRLKAKVRRSPGRRTLRKRHPHPHLIGSFRRSYHDAPVALKLKAVSVIVIALSIVVTAHLVQWFRVKGELIQLEQERIAGPRVRIARAKYSPPERFIRVVGEAKPFATATLYAKVSGYLKEIKVDKGDVVEKGQVLATIESPETDKAYQAALSDAKNRRNIARRMKTLLQKRLVSQQEAEQAFSDSEVAEARLATQGVEKGYETIKAPFSGTITARYADPGALIQNAANAQTGALPVVALSQINRLRIYFYLDQKDASFVQKGAPVEITLQEKPALKLLGTVSRLSGELDDSTKMMLTEVDLDNEKGDLVAGSFVQANLKVRITPRLQVPVESIILKDSKSYVAVVQNDNRVNFREVVTAENDGSLVTIVSGLKENEAIALNLGNAVAEGGQIRPLGAQNQ